MAVSGAAPLWRLTSSDIRSIVCPTCGAAGRARCITLRDRPLETVHRGRASGYLDIRFGITAPAAPIPRHSAPRLNGPGLTAVHTAHPQPWRLPLPELAALVDVSFLDLAKTVTAEAAGFGPEALTGLLYGRDRIHASIDALTFAAHDALLRREADLLSGADPRDEPVAALAVRERQLRRRMYEAEQELKRQRMVALTIGAPRSLQDAPIDDPQRLAAMWLGRYLRSERAELLQHAADTAGIPAEVSRRLRCRSERIEQAVTRGQLTAPVTEQVQALREMDDASFRRQVLQDAARQTGRNDDLSHPLLVDRWGHCLAAARAQAREAAHCASASDLTPLPHTRALHAHTEVRILTARRTLFASLVQRTGECRRTIRHVADAVTIAEHSNPQTRMMRDAAAQASAELIAAHPDLYREIRRHLKPHQTRYGRLKPMDAHTRGELRDDVWAGLDRLRGSRRRSAGN